MKVRGLVERDDQRYAYRLSDKGQRPHSCSCSSTKNPCGPLANSLFHHCPDAASRPQSKLKTAFHTADESVSNII
jgi:hypothetical protein